MWSLARERLRPGQLAFDLRDLERVPARVEGVADWTKAKDLLAEPVSVARERGRPRHQAGDACTVGTRAAVLWTLLEGVYDRLGFNVLGDPAFRSMVLARIVEPTSKADTVRVLRSLGVTPPALSTLYRALKRCQKRDYRDRLAKACLAHSARTSGWDCCTGR